MSIKNVEFSVLVFEFERESEHGGQADHLNTINTHIKTRPMCIVNEGNLQFMFNTKSKMTV